MVNSKILGHHTNFVLSAEGGEIASLRSQ
jgi:hypothetical protein